MKRKDLVKHTKKLAMVLGVALALAISFAHEAFAMEQNAIFTNDNEIYTGSIKIENTETGGIYEFPMALQKEAGQMRTCSDDGLITESYEAIMEIDKEGNVKVVDTVPSMPRTEASSSDSNTYWKAYISITYSVNNTTANLTKVSGSWTQLRGNTTLSDRYVYYAINGGNVGNSGEQRPSSNSFSYNTGFSSISSARLYSIGANSRATVTTEAGLKLNLTTNVEKRFTS